MDRNPLVRPSRSSGPPVGETTPGEGIEHRHHARARGLEVKAWPEPAVELWLDSSVAPTVTFEAVTSLNEGGHQAPLQSRWALRVNSICDVQLSVTRWQEIRCDDLTAAIGDRGPAVRTANKVWSGIAATVFCVVAITDLSHSASETSVASVSGTTGATTTPYTPPYATPTFTATYGVPTIDNAATQTGTAGESTTVTKVIDGDTLEVSGGRRVRFLGIDACEMSTQGGRDAKNDVDIWAPAGAPVTLVDDGDRDTDPYGRLLRRVVTSGGSDVGEQMIGYPSVGIYQGKNDASPSYVADLQARDDGPHNCGGAPTPTDTPAPAPPNNDDDHHDYVPHTPLRTHTGHSGHLCLPGERDGDHDGYCGEGR